MLIMKQVTENMEQRNSQSSPPRPALARQGEAGVTLLIAVLIMAGLTLITLSVGAFAIQEIRSSRAVSLTEPAIAAAETAGEQGLWAIKRGAALPTCPAVSSQSLGNSLINLCKSYGEARFTLKAGVPFVFYLYDPDNINSNTCNTETFDPSCGGDQYYQDITLEQKSGALQTDIQIDTVDGVVVAAESLIPGGDTVINIQAAVPGSSDLRFKVTLVSAGDATLQVNTNRGMPTFPTVDATGCSSKTAVGNCNTAGQEIFSRRINVTLPQ